MAGLQTEYRFTLPKGYVDGDGTLHRQGIMRLATARDEIEPLRDQRVDGSDDPYLTVLVMARVLTELGTLRQVTPREVEGLFAADLAFLQDLYGIINFGDPADVDELQRSVLPPEPPPAPEPAPHEPAGTAALAHADGTLDGPGATGDANGNAETAAGDDGSDTGDTTPEAPVAAARRRGLIEEVGSRAAR